MSNCCTDLDAILKTSVAQAARKKAAIIKEELLPPTFNPLYS
jgi:hypothetical protein